MSTVNISAEDKRLKGRNYVLIGMPGSGKSTLGKRVARMLGYQFVDTDDVLRSREGMTLEEINSAYGLAGFVSREEAAVISLTPRATIIATGGSVVYSAKAMRHLKKIGTVIYLDIPLRVLERRVGDLNKRGVLLPDGKNFAQLHKERNRLYWQYSDISFRTYRLSVGKSARLLAGIIRLFESETPDDWLGGNPVDSAQDQNIEQVKVKKRQSRRGENHGPKQRKRKKGQER